ncbi:MAG: TetR/AcrR family transcriptional regulator, partial [Candidatus Lindowbacteria bacterium]|nr:TetR/AcrR family transcriptional regulator [Candidatus Lindowbacteria bacterium]
MVSKTFLKIPKKKQDRVLRAAQIEFAKFGYHKTNINDICRRARISNGALYKYFKNKADLYQAVIDRQVEGKDEYMRGVLNSEGSCIEKIRLLMQNTTTEVGARNDTFRILLQLGASDMDKFAREVTRRIETTSFNHIRAILVQGIERGEVRPDIDLEM